MKKVDGFRLPVTHRAYDADGAAALRNDVDSTVNRLFSCKTLRDVIKDSTTTATRDVDRDIAAEALLDAAALATHDAAQQALVVQANTARANWANLAHAAQIAAGQQPPLYVAVPFVQPARIARDLRIEEVSTTCAADMAITLLCTGASLVELYEQAATALRTTQISSGHRDALRGAEALMRAALYGRTAAQAHTLLIAVVTDTILEFWKTVLQGYTADELAAAGVQAIEALLQKPITLDTAEDTVRQHIDAFVAVNAADMLGFTDRLVSSVLRACEPAFRCHLEQAVLLDELVRQARLGSAPFVRFMSAHAKLARAKTAADTHGRVVAALEVTIAGLRADHARLEAQLRPQQQQQQQQPRQAQRNDAQRERRARQLVGSPGYTGCNFVLPSGALCGNPSHARVDHPG